MLMMNNFGGVQLYFGMSSFTPSYMLVANLLVRLWRRTTGKFDGSGFKWSISRFGGGLIQREPFVSSILSTSFVYFDKLEMKIEILIGIYYVCLTYFFLAQR